MSASRPVSISMPRVLGAVAVAVTAFLLLGARPAAAESEAVVLSIGPGMPVLGTVGDGPEESIDANVFIAEVDGVATWLYCIDIPVPVERNQPHEEIPWDETGLGADALGRIARILAAFPASAATTAETAAGVQAAIWHYSNDFDLSLDPADNPPEVIAVYEAALAAAAAGPLPEPSPSLTISPVEGTAPAGSPVEFAVATTAATVELSVDDPAVTITDCAGTPVTSIAGSGTFCLVRDTEGGPATVTAVAEAPLSPGLVFARPGSQRIVLAGPVTVPVDAAAAATWTAAPANQPPTVTLECPSFQYGVPATWTATIADADDDELTVTWEILRGDTVVPVDDTDNDATASLTVQAGDRVRVTVSDGRGGTASAVSDTDCVPPPPPTPPAPPPPSPPPANTPPVVRLPCAAFTYGNTATWTATFSDADGDALAVTWAIVRNGTEIPVADSDNDATAVLTIEPGDVVRVTVADGRGGTATATSTTDCLPTTPTGNPPSIALVKTAAPTDLFGPGTVTFTYVITNTGSVRLALVGFDDDHGTPADPADDLDLGELDCGGVAALAPGEAVTCTASYGVPAVDVVTTQVNTATVVGRPVDIDGAPTGQPDVTATDDAEIVIRPEVVEGEVVVRPSPTVTPPETAPQVAPQVPVAEAPAQTLPVTGAPSTTPLTLLAFALVSVGAGLLRLGRAERGAGGAALSRRRA